MLYSPFPQILWSVKDFRCDAFLARPFDIDGLVLTVERLLARGRERRRFSLLAGTVKTS